MSQRKLTRRQRWRIEKIQDEKKQRLLQNEQEIEGFQKEAQHHSGLIIARHGKQVELLECSFNEKGENHFLSEKTYLCHIRANIPDMVVGDHVIWSKINDSDEDRGVIESLCERRSLLARIDKRGQQKIIAANITQVFLVLACEPHTADVVIDRYLAACELLNLPVKIILNKSDLAGAEKFLNFLKENYSQVVEEIFPCSKNNAEQMHVLEQKLSTQSSVFIGQSGVGKSSLIKTLLGNNEIKTQGLSARSGLGQHTTSSSRLYLLKNHGDVIDSPGIRDFDLDDVDLNTLQKAFREIANITTPCKFRDCVHDKEPDCEVRKAVNEGKIPELRYQNYLALAEQLGLIK